ncbi:CPBP family intramembrane metalloprotease [Lutibacter sp. B2]|nr:CPBP family intramembrane metalloprotease [Lutibacter sp. B2]
MKSSAKKEILGVNIVYLVTAIILLTIGGYVQSKNIKSGLIITEFILILLPPLIYAKIKKVNIIQFFRLKRLKIKDAILVVIITICTYPIALFFNLVFMIFISMVHPIIKPPVPTANDFGEYIILMFVVAVSAGICEEFFFRGLMLRGYEKIGKRKAIIFSAVLFGLFHFNIQNFAGPVVLGLIFGYLVDRTDSIFAGIIGHITNNGIAVTLGLLLNLANKNQYIQQNMKATEKMPNTMELVGVTIGMGIIAVIAGICVYGLMKLVSKSVANENIILSEKSSFVSFIPIFVSTIIYMFVVYLQLR